MVSCPTCGSTQGIYEHSDASPVLLCQKCRQRLPEVIGAHPALTCTYCGGHDFGWKKGSEWSAETIDEPSGTPSGRWVKADFDGAYAGEDRGVSGALPVSGRLYRPTIGRGVFSNARYVNAPPGSASSGDRDVWRQNAVTGVMESPEGPIQVTLTDFRLHDWQQVSGESLVGGTEGVHGRVRGTAYGRLKLDLEKEVKPEVDQPKPDQPEPPLTAPQKTDRPQDQGQTGRGLPDPTEPPITPPAEPPRRDCTACNPAWFLLIALFFWMACSWRAAVVAGLTSWLACKIQEWFCRRGIGFYVLPKAWRTALNIVGLVAAVWFALLALNKALMAAPFTNCGQWLFPGYWDFVKILVFCGLLSSPWPRRIVTFLFLWALLASCVVAGRSCGATAPQAVPQPSVFSPVTSTGPVGTPQQGAGAPSSSPSSTGPAAGSLSGLPTLQSLNESLSEIGQGLANHLPTVAAPDATDDLLEGMSSGGGGATLVSVTQANQNPDRYLGCFPEDSGRVGPTHYIYLGDDAFFERDSDQLKPSGSSLTELVEVMQARPDASWMITGHADTTGTDVYNLDLSRRRAQSVANWLVARGVPASRLNVVGAGSAVPLIRPEATIEEGGFLAGLTNLILPEEFLNRINRRVEVAITCPPLESSVP